MATQPNRHSAFSYPLNSNFNNMNAIYLTDLAQLYFPNSTQRSAVTQLKRWIKLNPELQQRLEELHYQKGQRTLTPLQHQAITEFLGEP